MDLQEFMKLDSSSKLELMLKDSDLVSKFKSEEIHEILMSLNQKDKIKVLRNVDFLKSNDLKKSSIIIDLFEGLEDENKRNLLLDKDFIEKDLNLVDWIIGSIIERFESDEIKLEMIDLYLDKLKSTNISDILCRCSDKVVTETLLEEKYSLHAKDIIWNFSHLKVISLVDFFREHKEFLLKYELKPYSITERLYKDKQLEIVSKLEDMGLSLKEKRQILVTLDEQTKKDIDKSNLPQEYVTAIEMKLSDKSDRTFEKIIIDYDKDLEIYRDLDELIFLNSIDISENKQKLLELYKICPAIEMRIENFETNLEIYRGLDNWININPINLLGEQKEKFFELCEICPEMNIYDNIAVSSSTVEEYKNAEVWIQSVLQGINPEWTDIQKVAYIDNIIGKEIISCAYLDTEIYDYREIQNMWKVADKKIGVCWGISELEKYILSKIGIEAEVVLSQNHAFLKLKNIEFPNADGTVVKGDTILDPTWNLVYHRYGGLPKNFCKSYEEMRKYDIIKSDGTDTESHKNDEALASATLDLDEKSLREIFTSIGIADKDGNFPIKKLKDKSKTIDDYNLPAEEAIKYQFQLLADYYPEFATCQNATMAILQTIVLNGENLKFNRCVVNRVYERNDENKSAVLYVYADLPEVGKKFYFADKETESFVELPEKEFEQKFECYEKDLEKQNGHRPWEDIEGNQEYISKNSIPAKDVGGR